MVNQEGKDLNSHIGPTAGGSLDGKKSQNRRLRRAGSTRSAARRPRLSVDRTASGRPPPGRAGLEVVVALVIVAAAVAAGRGMVFGAFQHLKSWRK